MDVERKIESCGTQSLPSLDGELRSQPGREGEL